MICNAPGTWIHHVGRMRPHGVGDRAIHPSRQPPPPNTAGSWGGTHKLLLHAHKFVGIGLGAASAYLPVSPSIPARGVGGSHGFGRTTTPAQRLHNAKRRFPTPLNALRRLW
jgi:hypothetical protein